MPVLRIAGDRLDPETGAALSSALLAGEILIYPTDTLYAVGGAALVAEAARRVRAAKGREAAKALPTVAADLEQVVSLCGPLSRGAAALAARFWPGPLTLVLRAAVGLPPELTAGEATIAVRVPARALTRELCRLAGPLISTSANRSGEPPALTCAEAVEVLGGSVAWAIDAGPGGTTASTIVDATEAAPRLLRPGAVDWEAVLGVWAGSVW